MFDDRHIGWNTGLVANGKSSAKPTASRLIREMARLPIGELDRLACNLLVLRSAKRNHRLPNREAALLMNINRTLPEADQMRYRRLCAKRRAGTLTKPEHRELIRLSDESEKINADRVKSIVALAAFRDVSVPELMESLGLDSLARDA